jgi:hypothetical protein
MYTKAEIEILALLLENGKGKIKIEGSDPITAEIEEVNIK